MVSGVYQDGQAAEKNEEVRRDLMKLIRLENFMKNHQNIEIKMYFPLNK